VLRYTHYEEEERKNGSGFFGSLIVRVSGDTRSPEFGKYQNNFANTKLI